MTKRILIVDDEEDIRDVIQASLEEFTTWIALTAASGAEGLQLARTESIDAVLLDISMPDMDGFQLCQALQTDRHTKDIPVIVLTAKVLPSDRQRFQALDVAGVISKPFNPLHIWVQIGELLGWAL
jgi:CheY-like chemotaxis protein